MKNEILALIALIIIIGTSCHKEIDTKKEEEAIKAVIENETNSYYAKNYDQQIKSFLQDENLVVLVASKNKYGYAVGWENISQIAKENSQQNPDLREKCQFKNYNIKVYKESAWVVFDEIVLNSENEFLRKIVNVRFLNKVDGKWEIVYLSHVDISSYDEKVDEKESVTAEVK